MAALAALGTLTAHAAEPDGWQNLFNGSDLTGWTGLIGKRPLGEIPPDHVVVRDGTVHMYADLPSGQQVDFGTMVHDRTVSRFHLSVEYQWGGKQFAPRATGLRDAGVLYFIPATPAAESGVWPTSVECQVQEGDTGDIVMINTSALTWANPEPDKAPEGQGNPGMLPEDGGVPILTGKGKYIGRFPVADKLDGWNTVEIIANGGTSAVHKVNGVIRGRLALIDGPDGKPLDSGKIGIQLEGAEILYRNIRVRELAEPLKIAAPYASLSAVAGISAGKLALEVENPGKSVGLDLKILGKDAASFRVTDAGGTTLAADAKTTLTIDFTPTGKAGRYSAGLQIGPEDGGAFVVLQGVATNALEGENEPPLERVIQALGIPVDVGGSALKLEIKPAIIGGSVPCRTFQHVGDAPVRLTPVARYSPPGEYPFGWQADGDQVVAGSLAASAEIKDAHQRLFPPLADGGKSVEIAPGNASFGLFVRAGKRTVGTDFAKIPSPLANPTRVYPIQVFQGRRVKNAFLVCFEEAANGDYQDCVFLVENVRVADGR